jgi:tRNA A-37 threonylcarbamoyl transferase component Bud32/flagellar motility protein MotE (MotC chaperone)
MTHAGDELNQRYRLVKPLGSGAMGSVWEAYDQLLDRTVAVKELVPQHAGIEDLPRRRERARTEARALAKVEHPAIVSIHDLISVGDDPWIVMGYASGRPLDRIIRDDPPMDEQSVAGIGLPVLHGLLACHARGVVHRDVKPANIVMARDGSIRLVDFGIAKILGESTLTASSKLLGTPEYLAPELLADKAAGPPSDLWALGVTLYYALERRSPFHTGSIEATITAILHNDPPRLTSRGALADMVLAMLRKVPAARPDGNEVAQVLRSVLGGIPSAQRPWWHRPDRPERRDQDGPERRDRPERPGPDARTRPAPGRNAAAADLDTVPLARMPTADAVAIVSGASTDDGVGMLVQLPEPSAARILDRCTNHVAGELIGGMAGTQPQRAAKILQIVSSGRAGRVLDYVSDRVAASILTVMPAGDAARILRECDIRTAGGALAQAPPRNAGQIVKAMDGKRAVDVLSNVAPVQVAAILIVVSEELRRTLLQRFTPSFRTLVRRFMESSAVVTD